MTGDATGEVRRGRLLDWRVAASLVIGVVVGLTAALLSGWLRPPEAPAPVPGAVDIGFAQDMSVHHTQAVTMAQEALDRSVNSQIRLVARQILATQTQERGTLAGWLAVWNAPALPAGPPMTWMTPAPGQNMGGQPMSGSMATTMPGMATQADLDHLATATGKDFDTLFLQLMIRHHEGGIIMATDARDHAGLPVVKALAGTMVIDQAEENAVMGQLLATNGGSPLPLN